jgi:hypothetical protein
MRKLLWIIPSLLLSAALGAPAAHADTLFTYMYSNLTFESEMSGLRNCWLHTGESLP